MKSLSQKEAIAILSDMKIDIPVPKSAVTQRKRNVALEMAISALSCSEMPNSSDSIGRQAAIDTMCAACWDWCDEGVCKRVSALQQLPSAQPEWNNHTVACLLAELFDDTCACNYNGIDEWLPEKCEVIDACPNPVGVACWEQFLKHRAERRTDG